MTPTNFITANASTSLQHGTSLTAGGIGAIIGGATGAVAGLAGSAKCWTQGITDKHWTALFDMFFWTALILGTGALLGSQNNGASMGLRLGQFGVIAFIFNVGVVTVHTNPYEMFSTKPVHGIVTVINQEGEPLLTFEKTTVTTDKKPVSVWKRLFLLTFVRCVWSPLLWFWEVWPLGLFFRTLWWSNQTSQIERDNTNLGLNEAGRKIIYEPRPEHDSATRNELYDARVPRKRQAWAVWSLTAIYLLLYVASFFLSIYFGNLLGGFVWPLIATQLVFGLAYTPFTMWFDPYVPRDLKTPEDIRPRLGESFVWDAVPTTNSQDVPLLHRERRKSCSWRRRLPSLRHQRLVKRLTAL